MRKVIIIGLFPCLFLGGFVLAQEGDKGISETENLFRAYQITSDNLNRLTFTLTFIAGVFAVFITGIVLFFAVKQILADKEIKEYKEAIKQNKIAIEKKTKEMLREIEVTTENITKREQKIEKSAQNIEKMEKILKRPSLKKIKSSKALEKAQSEIKNLKKGIEELKKDLSFQKGKIFSTVSDLDSTISLGIPASDVTRYASGSSIVFSPGSLNSKTCLVCFHNNEEGARFCSMCGNPL